MSACGENIGKNLPVRGLFSQKPPFLLDQSQRFPTSGRDFSEMVTNLGKSWQVGPPVECWLSTDTVGMNWKWFPWPVTRTHGEQFRPQKHSSTTSTRGCVTKYRIGSPRKSGTQFTSNYNRSDHSCRTGAGIQLQLLMTFASCRVMRSRYRPRASVGIPDVGERILPYIWGGGTASPCVPRHFNHCVKVNSG